MSDEEQQLVTFELHVLGLLQFNPGPIVVGAETLPMAELMAYGGTYTVGLSPVGWDMSMMYRFQIKIEEQPLAGWRMARADLRVNNFGWPEKPLSWYEDEPTDWATGLTRFPQPEQPRNHAKPWEYGPGPTWVLTARRSR